MDSLNSLVVNSNKATAIADLIEINTNAPSSGISSMNSSNTNSAGSSPSQSPKQQTIFPNLNQSQELKRQNTKLQELILPLSPSGLSVSSGNSSPLQQQLSSLSSKSDDVFYKYL